MIIRKRLRHALPALALILALLAGLFTGTAAAADTASDVTFTFTDSGVTASGGSAEGYQISGTDLTINAAGTYTVTGSCADGTITVKKGNAHSQRSHAHEHDLRAASLQQGDRGHPRRHRHEHPHRRGGPRERGEHGRGRRRRL